MSGSKSNSEQRRRAVRLLAEADAAEVLAEARERAKARAVKAIEDELFDELLDAATGPAGPTIETVSHEPVRTEPPSPPNHAWWAYGVLRADDADNVPPLEGVEPGSSVDYVVEGDLAALVSAVPADDYDDVHLREHLEDLEWVERTARRHEAVLEQILQHLTIVPLRLCTLYRDRTGVRALLREQLAALRETLAKVDGAAEWGVKVFGGAAAPLDAQPTEQNAPRDPEGSASPGATYLMSRQRERERAERASELRAACVDAAHRRISECAREATVNRPQAAEVHGREMTMVFNGAYLIANDRRSDLHDAVNALQDEWQPQGFVIELTGPWPAYNFVSEPAGLMS